jgi:hypothetical protein
MPNVKRAALKRKFRRMDTAPLKRVSTPPDRGFIMPLIEEEEVKE